MSVRGIAISVVALVVFVFLIARADGYQLFVISLVGLTAIVGIGLNVLLGLTGQISLGHAAFYAIGAYVVGILTTKTGLGFWIALPLATLIAAIAGALLAIPALRVRGPYLAMVTIAFGFVVEQGAAEWSELTGGWHVRVDQQFHQPGVVSIFPVDSVSARGDDRRRRARDGANRGRCRGRAAAGAAVVSRAISPSVRWAAAARRVAACASRLRRPD